MTQKRNIALDVIRCVALFCVIAVHFFKDTEFYNQPVIGRRMYIMVFMRSFFMVCVPLFLLLTGYLMRTKKPTIVYYKKLVSTLVMYLLACLSCEIYRLTISNEQLSIRYLRSILLRILRFESAPYAWYIEMYIGLFLIIPYLNICYNNISSQKCKKGLLLVLLILTAMPSVLNIYNLKDAHWWINPSTSNQYDPIIPDWWKSIYPITYYFIGSYLSEYPLKMQRTRNLIVLFSVVLLTGIFNIYRSLMALTL